MAHRDDGRMHVIMAGRDGQLSHNEQTIADPGVSWTTWSDLSNPGDRGMAVALAAHPDGRMHAIMAGPDGQVFHNVQTGTSPC